MKWHKLTNESTNSTCDGLMELVKQYGELLFKSGQEQGSKPTNKSAGFKSGMEAQKLLKKINMCIRGIIPNENGLIRH